MIHCHGEPETAEKATPTSDRRRAASLLDRVGRLTWRWIASLYYRWFYRVHMRLAHRFNWHYAPTSHPFEDGTRQQWCQWCGMRSTIPKPSTPLRRSGEQK